MSHTRDHRLHHHRQPHNNRGRRIEEGFTCRHCGFYVPCIFDIAGVQNRNHCPSCLWSRHLDGLRAGDRRSGCMGTMEPLGLTTKRSRNKYANERDGELMIIHRCLRCRKIAINRIAADDSAAEICTLFAHSWADSAALQTEFEPIGVTLLTECDHDLVRRRLWGNSAVNVEDSASQPEAV